MAHTTIDFREMHRDVHETDAMGVVAIARVVVESDALDQEVESHARYCVQRWLYESTVCGVGCFRFFLDELTEDVAKMRALRALLDVTDAKVASYGDAIPASILNAAIPQADGSHFGNLPVSGVRRVISALLAVLDASPSTAGSTS